MYHNLHDHFAPIFHDWVQKEETVSLKSSPSALYKEYTDGEIQRTRQELIEAIEEMTLPPFQYRQKVRAELLRELEERLGEKMVNEIIMSLRSIDFAQITPHLTSGWVSEAFSVESVEYLKIYADDERKNALIDYNLVTTGGKRIPIYPENHHMIYQEKINHGSPLRFPKDTSSSWVLYENQEISQKGLCELDTDKEYHITYAPQKSAKIIDVRDYDTLQLEIILRLHSVIDSDIKINRVLAKGYKGEIL